MSEPFQCTSIEPALSCVADVYSYEEDDMVEDPHLAVHLAHFGIDVMSMQKVCGQHQHHHHSKSSYLT